jgi:hypothetical protein
MRKSPSAETYKLLYVRSGNVCAFPGCNHPIFNDDGLYIAELCHIKAANEGGPRYDSNQTDEERRSPDNLLFMCHRHHKETDDLIKYPPNELQKIKANHELQFKEYSKQISDEMIKQIEEDSKYFWNCQKEKTFELDDLKMKTNLDSDETNLYEEILQGVDLIYNYCNTCAKSDDSATIESDLKDLMEKAGLDFSRIEHVPYHENPFINRNWEYHNIGLPNLFSNLRLKLFHLRVMIFERIVMDYPDKQELKLELDKYRKEFEDIYDNSYHVD